MKTVEKINVTRANNEVITVEVERNFTAQKSSILFTLQNVITELVIKENRKCLKISKYAILRKEVRLALEKTLNCKLPADGDIYITITDDSFSKLEQIIANFSKEVEDFNADFEARASKMNKFYVMYKFLDYTDYDINDVREIRVYREAMSDENIDKVLVKTYKLDNLLDENLRKEFDNDFNSAESLLNETEVRINEKVAEKWINVSEIRENEIKVAEESKRTAKMLDLQKIEEEKESKKRDALRKAIETGKKVVIESYFVQGSDIPEKFRKSDSDMGEYVIYAMPDGTIKEDFIHAY